MSSLKLCFIIVFIATSLLNYFVLSITDWKKIDQGKFTLTERSQIPNFLPNTRGCLCIPLQRCLPLYNLLSFHPVHTVTTEFLRNQTCGFFGREPYVCCYDSNDPTSSTPPDLPHPRVERCMVSPEDAAASNEVETSSEVPKLYPRFYPFHGPSHGPHGFPSPDHGFNDHHNSFPHGDYHGDDHHSHGNSHTSPTFGNKIGKASKEVKDDVPQTPKTRSQLLPDDTCGLALDERIVGGKDVRLGIYPWMARIGYTRPRSSEYIYRCGGTLINSRFVITAAHCTSNLPGGLKLASVRLGELDERTDPDCDKNECADRPQDFTPITVIVHRNYDTPKYKNDISLLKLDRDVNVTPYVSPICLPYNFMKSTNYSGLQATAAGWGIVNIAVRTSSPILQHVQLRVSDNSSCQTVYSTKYQLDVGDEQMCTVGLNGEDACEGDSGGPLMRFEQHEGVPRYFLMGVVSFGPTQCGTSGLPSVNTRVSFYLDWILKHIDV